MKDKYSQEGILEWAVDTFGPVAKYRHERVMRFVEEAIELAHAWGLDELTLHKIEDRVYGRPAGNIGREISQCAVTLKALAEVYSLDLEYAAKTEIDRVHSIPKEEWEKRHAAKVAIGIASVK